MAEIADVITALTARADFYVSTVDADGHPRVRPFGLAFNYNNHLCIATSTQKKVYAQLQKNPWIEICAYDANAAQWVRVNGKVTVVPDREAKVKAFQVSPGLLATYKGPDDPIFAVLSVAGQADFYSFKSLPNVSRTIKLT
jgi:uncharacterized pyridoxamine 5'-phosphate oxidase family protein